MKLSKYLIGLIILVGCASGGQKAVQTTQDFANAAVMISLEDRQSGGSGVVLRSTATKSWVLTNKHICNLIQNGGIVTNDEGSYPIASYRPYKRHDLCLVEVMANLHANTRLAETPPPVYSETVIAGHPALLPTMVTRGHFTNKMTIQLIVDVTDCDGSEETEEEIEMCLMFGKKPIIKTFESQPTTATIMPGSSGSGVFNSKGEVSGLVFAGQRGLSYGFLVPYEYIKDFLSNLSKYPAQYPDRNKKAKSLFADMKKIEEYCLENREKCQGAKVSGIYYNER